MFVNFKEHHIHCFLLWGVVDRVRIYHLTGVPFELGEATPWDRLFLLVLCFCFGITVRNLGLRGGLSTFCALSIYSLQHSLAMA